MRAGTVVAFIVLSLFIPFVGAHGANDFAIILRGSSMQPNQADIMQNDSLVFFNTADENRTIRVDLDGDGVYDQRCETEPSNSSSIRDQCSFWIDPSIWLPGNYEFDVFSNDSLWKTLEVLVVHDLHQETGPPSDYSFNSEPQPGEADADSIENGLKSLALVFFIAYGVAVLTRRRGNAS